jgi:hypothetical protein
LSKNLEMDNLRSIETGKSSFFGDYIYDQAYHKVTFYVNVTKSLIGIGSPASCSNSIRMMDWWTDNRLILRWFRNEAGYLSLQSDRSLGESKN